MFNRVVTILSLSSLVVLLVMLNFTSPADIGPLGVLLFFGLVYLILFGVALVIVAIFRKILQRKGKMGRKGHLYAALLAFAPIMLLLAQSMGSLGWFTFVLVALFVGLGCFLISKRG